MYLTFGQILALLVVFAALIIMAVMAGGWMMFRGKTMREGENFFTGVAKGEVFTIPDATDEIQDNPAEKSIASRTNDFMKLFESKTGGA